MTSSKAADSWRRATGTDLPERSTFDRILWFVLVVEALAMCAGVIGMCLSLVASVLAAVFYREVYDVEIAQFPLPFKIMAGLNVFFLVVLFATLLVD
jgi:hypothetical protein